MELKKIGKYCRRLLARYLLFLSSLIIRVLPKRYLYSFAVIIGKVSFLAVRRQRRIAKESLDMAFGSQLGAGEKDKIARACFINIAKSAVETLYVVKDQGATDGFISIEGKENLDQALAEGKGALVVSAHFGNFPLAIGKLSRDGYRVNVILSHMHDKVVDGFFEGCRRKFGVKTIYSKPRQACVDNSFKALRNNEILFILLDQNYGSGGVFVEFFGRDSATATGPVIFALRTEAALVPIFVVRAEDNTNKIIILKKFPLQIKGKFKDNVQANVQAITAIIESYVRKYPAQWGWIHRRWKTLNTRITTNKKPNYHE